MPIKHSSDPISGPPTTMAAGVGKAAVFWLYGLSGAGKSTLATRLSAELRRRGTPVLALDGDALRHGINRGLGFSAQDRTENLRRAACIARIGLESGLCSVASFITPLEAHRQMIRELVGRDSLAMIYVDAPLEVCRQRDVKGLYARAAEGAVAHFTGMSDPFESPVDADLVLPTSQETVEASAAKLLEHALSRLAQRQC